MVEAGSISIVSLLSFTHTPARYIHTSIPPTPITLTPRSRISPELCLDYKLTLFFLFPTLPLHLLHSTLTFVHHILDDYIQRLLHASRSTLIPTRPYDTPIDLQRITFWDSQINQHRPPP